MNWISVESIPVDTFVLVHTKGGKVRVAKKVIYKNGSHAITYSSIYFKDVTHWMPLPESPTDKPIERGAGDDYPVIEPQNWK